MDKTKLSLIVGLLLMAVGAVMSFSMAYVLIHFITKYW